MRNRDRLQPGQNNGDAAWNSIAGAIDITANEQRAVDQRIEAGVSSAGRSPASKGRANAAAAGWLVPHAHGLSLRAAIGVGGPQLGF